MYSHPKTLNDFHWKSSLSTERQEEILLFISGLSVDEVDMIDEIIGDTEQQIAFDNCGEEQ